MGIFIYLNEVKFYFFYIILSFIFIFIISFKKLFSILIFLSFPLIKITKKKLILIHLWELFNSSWFLTINIANYFLFISIIYYFLFFFNSSLYYFQKKKLINFFFLFFSFFFLFFSFFYILNFYFLKLILIWDFILLTIHQIFDLQLQLATFLENQLFFISISLFYFFFIFFIIYNLWLFLNINLFYLKIKNLRKKLIFFSSILSILIFYDFYSQLFSIILNLLFFEIIFFWSCYKNSNFLNNAYFKTNFEKE